MTTPRTAPARPAAACCAPLAAAPLSADEAAATAALFKALADPHRVRIVNLLATRPEPALARLAAVTAVADPSPDLGGTA